MEIQVNDTNFDDQVLKSDVPVLVDFWAQWCAPCFMIAPAVEEIAREYDGKLKVCKANVDEGPQVAARYGIRAIPTVMVFNNGQMVEQIVGVVPKERLLEKINPYLGENV